MYSRQRSESPSVSECSSFVAHQHQLVNQGGPIVPPRRNKRGRSLSTTQLSSFDSDARGGNKYAMPPMNQALGYDRGNVLEA